MQTTSIALTSCTKILRHRDHEIVRVRLNMSPSARPPARLSIAFSSLSPHLLLFPLCTKWRLFIPAEYFKTSKVTFLMLGVFFFFFFTLSPVETQAFICYPGDSVHLIKDFSQIFSGVYHASLMQVEKKEKERERKLPVTHTCTLRRSGELCQKKSYSSNLTL